MKVNLLSDTGIAPLPMLLDDHDCRQLSWSFVITYYLQKRKKKEMFKKNKKWNYTNFFPLKNLTGFDMHKKQCCKLFLTSWRIGCQNSKPYQRKLPTAQQFMEHVMMIQCQKMPLPHNPSIDSVPKNSCKFVRFYAWKRTYGGIFKRAGESTGSQNVSQAQSAITERPWVSRRHWKLELITDDSTFVKNVCVVQKICLMNGEMKRKKKKSNKI